MVIVLAIEYYLIIILVLVSYLVILSFKKGRITYSGLRDSDIAPQRDRQIERIERILQDIQANQPSGQSPLKEPDRLARIEQKLDRILTEFDIKDSSKDSSSDSSYPIRLQTEFDVMLNTVPVDKKIAILKEVRTLTGLGLREAKDLIESRLPVVVKSKLSAAEAEKAKTLLQEAGADVFLR
jgi:ribosomal protein L7/L12